MPHDAIVDVQRVVGPVGPTPLDPRHRLVTTKYNPARTWTAENSVGIGGAYLCVYGMEGPGGYQFVGRTTQVWSPWQQRGAFEPGSPWLLRFFDQVRFFPVDHDELTEARAAFPHGAYPIRIEETAFSYADYAAELQSAHLGIVYGFATILPCGGPAMIKEAERLGMTIQVQAARYEGYTVWVNAMIESAGGEVKLGQGPHGVGLAAVVRLRSQPPVGQRGPDDRADPRTFTVP